MLYTPQMIWNNGDTFDGGIMTEYLLRSGSHIEAVRVSPRMVVPIENLMTPFMEIDGQAFWLHPNGGGVVADSSHVPDHLRVPYGTTVGPKTELLDDRNLSGQHYVYGNFSNFTQVSRVIDEDGTKLRQAQRELGIVRRLELIDANRRQHLASLALRD